MGIKKKVFFSSLLLLFTSAVVAENGLPDKVSRCVSCHGELGVSHYDLWPNIAGQKRGYLLSQLKAFRNGSRHDPWMTPIAQPLNDDEIEQLAEFFSELPLGD